jgi:hypothetical protein
MFGRFQVCGQTRLITSICALDLASTIWLCNSHGAGEGNPMMAYFYTHGPLSFISAKAALTIVPLAILEAVRRSQPRLAILALNTVLCCYIAFYGVGMARVNNAVSEEEVFCNKLDGVVAQAWEETRRRIELKRHNRAIVQKSP